MWKDADTGEPVLDVFSLFDAFECLAKEPYISVIVLVPYCLGESDHDNGCSFQAVVGRACGDRIAVVSTRDCVELQHAFCVTMHECLHTIGFDHCNTWKCMMNACDEESYMFLSPVNLRKLQHFHSVASSGKMPGSKHARVKFNNTSVQMISSSMLECDTQRTEGNRRSKRLKRNSEDQQVCAKLHRSSHSSNINSGLKPYLLEIFVEILGAEFVEGALQKYHDPPTIFTILRYEALQKTLIQISKSYHGVDRIFEGECQWISRKLNLIKQLHLSPKRNTGKERHSKN